MSLYVFDLDDTLWNWSNKTIYPDVVEILSKLKKAGNYVYLASFNPVAPVILHSLQIYNFFDGVRYGRLMTKAEMIRDIVYELIFNKNIVPNRVYFFDDMPDNIYEVQAMNTHYVHAVHTPQGVHKYLF